MSFFKMILLFIFTFHFTYSSNTLTIPEEVCHKIKYYVTPLPHNVPVLKFNKTEDSKVYDYVQSYFPSTSSFQLVNIKQDESSTYKPDPKSVVQNSCVVPSIQGGLNFDGFKVSYVLSGKSPYGPLRCADPVGNLFFDVKDEKAVFLLKTRRYVLIGLFNDSNKSYGCERNVLSDSPSFEQKQFIPQSLCFHATDPDEFSIIAVEDYVNCAMSIFNLVDEAPQRKFTIPVPLMGTIKKHEYIDKDVFLLLDGVNLFFCAEKSGEMITSLQSFFDNKAKNKQGLYSIISFCVNQNKRTPTGRARCFFVLAELASQKKGAEQVILYVDLLNHYNTVTKIWSLKREEDSDVYFDRISYNEEGFCLWNDADGDTSAMIIRFPLDWMDVLENGGLFALFYKEATSMKSEILQLAPLNQEESIIQPVVVPKLPENESIRDKLNNQKQDRNLKKFLCYHKFKILSLFLLSGVLFLIGKSLKNGINIK